MCRRGAAGSRKAWRAWLAGFITAGDGEDRPPPASNQPIQTETEWIPCFSFSPITSNQRFGTVLFEGTEVGVQTSGFPD
jgi:hypothetical protein